MPKGPINLPCKATISLYPAEWQFLIDRAPDGCSRNIFCRMILYNYLRHRLYKLENMAFNPLAKGQPLKYSSVKLHEPEYRQLQALAAENGISVTCLINKVIRTWIRIQQVTSP